MKIQRKHALGKAHARNRIEKVADGLCSQYGLQSSWQGDELTFNGSGVNGCIVVGDDLIDVDVKLGLALSMLESTVKTSIESAMDKHLRLPASGS